VGLATFGTLLAGMVALAPQAAADDSSAVTVTAQQQDPDAANAPFPDLSVTVSQTKNLMSQGIRLTYAGGSSSTVPSQQEAGRNFLQVFQCWDDLKDENGNLVLDGNGQPQPDRTTCQYGSTGAVGQSRSSTKLSTDDVAPEDVEHMAPGSDYFNPTEVSIPFRSVTGKTLRRITNGVIDPNAPGLDQNEFFTRLTTNEVAWAGFDASGIGSTTFEAQTNMQAPGLGCGNPVEGAGGAVTGQPCWLVILPRGSNDVGETSVVKSGLLWENWKHRLAVKLDFKPLGVRCALGAAERSTAGSELMTAAVASWQPVLCGATSGSIYNLIIATESDVALQANGTELAPLALTSRALSTEDVTDELTYAPVAITGLAVAFAVDRRSDPIDPDVPGDVKGQDGQAFSQMNLSPRLLAKLLTSSYIASLPTYADLPYLEGNPINLTEDPDFLALNPQWAHQDLKSPAIADVIVPLGRSDSAHAVWRYILADADASAFLSGEPDPWGMVVNPWASTVASANPSEASDGIPIRGGLVVPRDDFPKVDPVEVDIIGDAFGRSVINVVTWRPYAPDYDTAGYWTLRGDGRLLGDWDSISIPPRFRPVSRALVGEQKVLGLTDIASAAKYQVFTAALLNPAGEFVTPTTEAMESAAAAMTPYPDQPTVYEFDPQSAQARSAVGAYPLTIPVYAATNPEGGDADSREAYAAFIRYAAGAGQTPGTDLGQLPPGYAPLPQSWRAQALAVANEIAAGQGPTPSQSPVPSPSLLPGTPPAGVLPVTADLPAIQPDPSQAPVPSSPTPTPTSQPPGAVVGAATPEDPSIGALAAAVPMSVATGLLAAAATPLFTRLRRIG
jgi:hypothetical protein